ncbi:MAG TPA: protein kinase [Urbifossiella sp.]|jgi:serine/threonine-protein kinase|nr:protein kinase [Urbifossiella sp.]
MQIASAESLIDALRASGLFAPAAVDRLARELAPFGTDTQAALRHLVDHDRVPVYQLRKIIHGKTAELFVGPFVVLDKLGEGGMGKVFKARDLRSGRVAAVKVVRPHLLANPVVRGRYEREVKAALALRHPNIAAAFEAGEVGGKVYLALEFVDGIDLARLVKTFGVLPVSEACEYLRQTALGLAHAHAHGFVHRDIKPGNIVVAGERHHPGATEPAVVKLLDMGLVRTVGLEEDGPGGTDLTRAGTVLGTPDYMAPEQAKNSSLADHRADLYSLGGAFYFLLTGKPPFPAGSPIEKILKHQHDPPPPLQAVRPDVPDRLARLVARLLAKKPGDRFASAEEVAAALEPLAQFTAESSAVRLAIPGGVSGPEGVDTAGLSSSKTVPPSSHGEGIVLPRSGVSAPAPAGSPTPPTPVVIELPPAPTPSDGWKVWVIAAVSAAAGVAFGILAWAALLR